MRTLIILVTIAIVGAACLDQPPRPGPGPGVDAFVPLPDVGSGSGFDAFVAEPEHAGGYRDEAVDRVRLDVLVNAPRTRAARSVDHELSHHR